MAAAEATATQPMPAKLRPQAVVAAAMRLPDPVHTPPLTELAARFSRLSPTQTPRWGRMNAAQMTRHCRTFAELCLGRVRTHVLVRVLARVLGPIFLRRMLAKPPHEAPKNLGTLRSLRTADTDGIDLERERRELLAVFDQLNRAPDPMRHPLYGRMRRDDVIALVRHHTAHHLNQFGLLDSDAAAP